MVLDIDILGKEKCFFGRVANTAYALFDEKILSCGLLDVTDDL
jgi:hypothetical protein